MGTATYSTFPRRSWNNFSGSAVVDLKNTSGFGTTKNPPIVAIYTNHNSKEEKMAQKISKSNIAYSLDEENSGLNTIKSRD